MEVGSKLQWLLGKLSKHSGNIDGLIQAVGSFMSKDKSEPVLKKQDVVSKEQNSVLKTSQINDFYSFLSSDMMSQIVQDIFARRRKKR